MPAVQTKPRVIIAEDEVILAFVLRGQLERNGVEVVGVAANGVAALERCRETRPDVILMDVRMPQTDGISATRRIMEECPTCVIIVTAFADEKTMEKARRAGAMGFLSKPVQIGAVMEEMPEALGRFQEFRAVREECPGLRETLEALEMIAAAKVVLVKRGRAKAEEAFDLIRAQAAKERVSLVKEAQSIVGGS